jgi:hypothetical protein
MSNPVPMPAMKLDVSIRTALSSVSEENKIEDRAEIEDG